MTNENFYIALPNEFTSKLVIFNGKNFEKCCLKCGEAIDQKVEDRLRQEAPQAGGMACVYMFYMNTNKISKSKKNHFDTDVFGHKDIKNCFDKTIWCDCDVIPSSMPKILGFGTEYMDCANLLNAWLKTTDDSLITNILSCIKKSSDETETRMWTIDLIRALFEINFTKYVENYTGENLVVKKELSLFEHQAIVLIELINMIENEKRNIITQLPPRFGKTLTFLSLFNESSVHKVMIVSSYTKTVGSSYIKEINTYSDFNNIQGINIDLVKDFEYTGGKVVIEFPTTGSETTMEKRIGKLAKILKMMNVKSNEIFLLNEEADFGNHTEKSNNKFEILLNKINKKHDMLIISTTGTEAFKAEKITAFGNVDGYISVNKNDWNQIIV